MISKIFRFAILGAPGSGKGTISDRIVRDFGVIHLSSGTLLRSEVQKKSDLGLTVQKYTNEGQLVPDELMTEVILNQLEKIGSFSWLLDGFPRTVTQARILQKQQPLDTVINLNVPFEEIINRIKGRSTHIASGRVYHDDFNPPQRKGFDDITGEPLVQRNDDKPEVVQKRLRAYEDVMLPVLQFYRERKILQEFHGRESNVIWPQIHKYLLNFIPEQMEAREY